MSGSGRHTGGTVLWRNPVTGLLVLVPVVLGRTEWQECALAACMTVWALLLLPGRGMRRWNVADVAVAGYCVWVAVNALWREGEVLPGALLAVAEMGLVYFLARRTEGMSFLFVLLAVCGGVEAVRGVLQHFGVLPSPHAFFPMTGNFGNPGPLAGFVALAALAAVGTVLFRKEVRWMRGVCIALLPLFAVVLWLADSRAAWLSLFAGGAVFFAGGVRSRDALRWVLVVGMLLLAVGVFAFYFLRPASADGRLLIWKVSVGMVAESPVAGHGAGSFEAQYMYRQADWLACCGSEGERLNAGNNFLAFNEWLRVACEEGAVGVLLLAVVLFRCVGIFLRCRGCPDVRLACALLAVLLVFSCFSYPLYFPAFRMWLALLVAVVVGHGEGWAFPAFRWGGCVHVLACAACLVVGAWLVVQLHLAERAFREKDWEGLAERASHLEAVPSFAGRYGHLLFEAGKYEEAERWLWRASALRPSVQVICNRGICLQQSGRHAEAVECFREAGRMAPGLMRPRYLVFDNFRMRGLSREAVRVGNELLRLPVKLVNSETLAMKLEVRRYLEAVAGGTPGSGKGGDPTE